MLDDLVDRALNGELTEGERLSIISSNAGWLMLSLGAGQGTDREGHYRADNRRTLEIIKAAADGDPIPLDTKRGYDGDTNPSESRSSGE